MKQESFDALFSNFFSRNFLSLILTKHRKNRKNNQFSIYLRNYLFLDETKRSFVDDDKNLNFKLFIDNDLHDSNIDVVVLFVIIVNFVIFIFFSFFFIFFVFFLSRDLFRRVFLLFHFFFLLFNKIRVECDLRRNTILNVDAKLLLRRKTKIDRDDDARTFKRTSENIVHILIDITFNRTLRTSI